MSGVIDKYRRFETFDRIFAEPNATRQHFPERDIFWL
jgi:hypothetical protein